MVVTYKTLTKQQRLQPNYDKMAGIKLIDVIADDKV